MPANKPSVRLAADIGGTFTDIVLELAEQRFSSKVLTTPSAPELGVLRGIDALLREADISPGAVELLVHGTTLATNALIERKGAVTGFLTTEGFRDVLATGFEKRYDQNRVFLPMPEPLVPRPLRFTVRERLAADGSVLRPLNTAALEQLPALLEAAGVEALAIGFLHAFAHPDHERAAREVISRAMPDLQISLSSEVCPELREFERFSTTVANAYVQPLMAGYLVRLRDALLQRGLHCPLLLMTSGGGLTTLDLATRFPIRLVESGPAGGALLAAHCAAELGLQNVLSFDMGGTTAKICLLSDAQPQRSRRFEVARIFRHMKGSGLPLRIPVIEMVEIGAGGGSIARVDGMGRVSVGPDSAGAAPGPACYSLGGAAPTVTDANLLLGRLDPDAFAGGSMTLDVAAARSAMTAAVGVPGGLDEPWPAAAVVEIVDENMANAARVHAIERGKDVAAQTIIAFGGGAPMHAGRLAQKLGIRRIVVPLGAGVGSAIGFLRAPVAFEVVRSLRVALGDAHLPDINALLATMIEQARAVVVPAVGDQRLTIHRQVDVRYVGQGHELTLQLPDRPLEEPDRCVLRAAFERRYLDQYGLTIPAQAVETVTWSVRVSTDAVPAGPPVGFFQVAEHPAVQVRDVIDPVTGDAGSMGVYARAELAPGARLAGPALITEAETTTLVPAGFELRVDTRGYLILERGEF